MGGFVVYGVERLRDGIEEWAKCFVKKDDALKYINDTLAGLPNNAYTFRLFELGAEIDLVAADVEVPQPSKVVRQVKA